MSFMKLEQIEVKFYLANFLYVFMIEDISLAFYIFFVYFSLKDHLYNSFNIQITMQYI